MPLRPAAPGVFKHQLYMTSFGQPSGWVTTLWTYHATRGGQARADAERAQIAAFLNAEWKPRTSSQITAERIATWDFGLSPPSKFVGGLLFPAPVGTAGASTPLLQLACGVIALRSQPVGSAIRNRLNGRIFHPSINTSVMTGNYQLTTGEQTALKNAYEALKTRLQPTNPDCGQWSIISFFAGGAVRPEPLVIPVDHILVRQRLGTQRRRILREGPYARGA